MRAILTYHSIDPSRSVISVTEQEFRRHVEWLAASSVKVLALTEIVAAGDSEDSVAITFDDAFANFRAIALPLLENHGLPATLFVATSQAGGTNAWPVRRSAVEAPVLPLLDWDGVAAVAERGVSIGSHCRTHRPLTSLDAPTVREELTGSSEDLRRELGISPAAVAYPYGAASAREREEAARVYDLAVGTELKVLDAGDNPHMLPRLDAYYLREPGRLESFGSRRLERFLRVRNRGRRLRASVTRLLGQEGG